MNYERCQFCRKRVPKKARMDARYCSAACRNAAQRQRKREGKLRQWALSAAQRAAAESPADAEARRLLNLRDLFIEQMQGKRFAAQCPALKVDPWLQGHATLQACALLIEHLQQIQLRVKETIEHVSKPQDRIGWRLCDPKEAPLMGRGMSHVGAAILPDLAGGHVVILYTERPESAKDRATSVSSEPTSKQSASAESQRRTAAQNQPAPSFSSIDTSTFESLSRFFSATASTPNTPSKKSE